MNKKIFFIMLYPFFITSAEAPNFLTETVRKTPPKERRRRLEVDLTAGSLARTGQLQLPRIRSASCSSGSVYQAAHLSMSETDIALSSSLPETHLAAKPEPETYSFSMAICTENIEALEQTYTQLIAAIKTIQRSLQKEFATKTSQSLVSVRLPQRSLSSSQALKVTKEALRTKKTAVHDEEEKMLAVAALCTEGIAKLQELLKAVSGLSKA